MLTITIPGVESFDNSTQTFVDPVDVVLNLEHSLVSLSKWEAEWEKPFLTDVPKASDEVYGYIRAMSLEGEIPIEVLYRLTEGNLKSINDYLEAKMTATWFNEVGKVRTGVPDIVTSEVIYHWMVALQINWECQYWHLNKLITLVKTISEKNKSASEKKKAPTSAQMSERRSLMEQRRAAEAERNS